MADGHHEAAATSVAWFMPLVGVVTAALGAFGLWLAQRMLGKAAFQQAINSGFKELTEQLQEERARIADTLADERLGWAKEKAQLTGDVINLTQALESLKAHLRRLGIEVPEGVYHPPADLLVIEGGKTHEQS